MSAVPVAALLFGGTSDLLSSVALNFSAEAGPARTTAAPNANAANMVLFMVFAELYGAEAAADLLHTTAVAAIGPVTAEAAAQLGISTSIIPSQYSIPALAAEIVKYFEGAGAKAATS